MYVMGVICGQLSDPELSSDSCLCRRTLCSNKAVGRSKNGRNLVWKSRSTGLLAIATICAFSIDILISNKIIVLGSLLCVKVAKAAESHNLQQYSDGICLFGDTKY